MTNMKNILPHPKIAFSSHFSKVAHTLETRLKK